jgi:hypothetical protein
VVSLVSFVFCTSLTLSTNPLKLQLLPGGPSDQTMIRLFDFDPSEASQLLEIVKGLIDGSLDSVALHKLPFITLLNDLELTAILDERIRDPHTEFAILGGAGATSFIWRGTREERIATAAAILPFTEHCDSTSYAWLTEDLGVMLLLSSSGSW